MIMWTPGVDFATQFSVGRSIGRRWLPSIIALFVLVPLVATRPAAAQGTDGALANPISTRELMDYAERLGLSNQQQLALESIHDDYKREFRLLREGEIAEFMDQTNSMAGRMPKREVVEKLLKDMERLSAKIENVDDRLMNRLQLILTEEQLAALPRIRDRRERHRYSTVQTQQMMMMSGRRSVDLSDIYTTLDLEPDALASTDPSIASYERKLTMELRKINKAIYSIYLDMFDAIENMGFSDIDMTDPDMDPEEMQRFAQAMQQIWLDLMTKIGKMTASVAELDQRTLRSVAAILPPDQARVFKDQYYSRAVPETMIALTTMGESAWLHEVMKLDILTAAERELLTAVLDELNRKMDRHLDELLELAESQQQGLMAMFDPDAQAAMEEHQEKLSNVQTEAQTALSDAMTALAEVIDEERLAELRLAALEEGGNAEAIASTGVPVEVALLEEAEAGYQWTGDMFLTPRISKKDVSGYARRLDLEEGMRDVVMSLHADYVRAHDEQRDISELKDATANLWNWDPETQESTAPSDQKIERILSLRRRAIEAIRALENGFFDELLVIAGENKESRVDRIRRNRERSCYLQAQASAYGSYQSASAEGSIDLVTIVQEARLDEAELAQIDDIMRRYEEKTLELLRTRLEAQLALQCASEKWTAASQRVNASGEPVVDWQDYQKTIGPPTAIVNESTKAIGDLTRTYLEELATKLTSTKSRDIRRAYDRRAYPNVFNDPVAVDTQLAAALELQDLTSEQRSQLVEVAAAYRPDYEELSRRMIEFSREGYDFTNFEMADFQSYQERQRELEKLGYDRDELSFRAASRLKATLSEEQIRRIGGLPQPPEDDGMDMFR